MTANIFLSRKLHRPLILALTVLGTAAALAYAGHAARQGALAERDTAAAQLSHSENRLRQIQREQKAIPEQAALFSRLQEAGIVGDAKPVEWIQMLYEISQQMRLSAMKHEFIPAGATVEEASFNFHSATLKLQLQLLHEAELLDFLERLQQEAKALVLLRACRLARLPQAAGESQSNLSADCEMEWVTAYRKKATGHE